jgi:GTP-binding protein YchF
MKAAIVGYAQAGKKTLFKLLTNRDVPQGRKEDEAVEGAASVYDSRVETLAKICKPQKTKYAETLMVLCPDVPEGGKGSWMEAARKCDLLCVVLRAFTAPDVFHPRGSVDAARDRSDLATEIVFADVDMVDKRLERIAKEKRAGQTVAQQIEEKALTKCRDALAAGKWLKDAGLDENDLKAIRTLGLMTLAPVLWVYNVDESGVQAALEAEKADPGAIVVSCKIEREIMAIENREERAAFLGEVGFAQSGLERLNTAAYDTLGLMSFYTAGPDEVRAWTIRKGSTAPVAAGKIHSDIERGFIRAEVTKFDDLVAAGGEAEAKAKGKTQIKGKDYVIEDGDICHFRFSV